MDLTVREEGTEWQYGTPILDLLLERFHRCFSRLQEAGRAGHGAMPRRGALHRSGCRIQFHRHHRETHGGKHAFAMMRSEEHTSELQSHLNLVCRLLLEKKKNQK